MELVDAQVSEAWVAARQWKFDSSRPHQKDESLGTKDEIRCPFVFAIMIRRKRDSSLKKWALIVTGLHLVIVIFHAAAHKILAVDLSSIQLIFVVTVIILGPLAAAFLIVKSARPGALLFLLTMIASLIFGLYFHFVADSADNVFHAAEIHRTAWSEVFASTAYLLALGEALGAAIGGLLYFGRKAPQ